MFYWNCAWWYFIHTNQDVHIMCRHIYTCVHACAAWYEVRNWKVEIRVVWAKQTTLILVKTTIFIIILTINHCAGMIIVFGFFVLRINWIDIRLHCRGTLLLQIFRWFNRNFIIYVKLFYLKCKRNRIIRQ